MTCRVPCSVLVVWPVVEEVLAVGEGRVSCDAALGLVGVIRLAQLNAGRGECDGGKECKGGEGLHDCSKDLKV